MGVLAFGWVAAGCAAPPVVSDPGLRSELTAVARADLRERNNPTRDPRVVNALWGDALLRRATPLTSRPVRGPAASPTPLQDRSLLVTTVRPPLAGLPGASPATTPADQRFAEATVGRLFFTMDSVPRTCTAQVLASDSGAVLGTAGHCLLSTGESGQRSWAQNLMFVPGYRDGGGPAGRWFADFGPEGVVVTAGWQSRQDWSDDVGFVRVLPRGGVDIQDLTGGLGAAFGDTAPTGLEILGYPAAGRFDGARLQSCRSDLDPSFGPNIGQSPAAGAVPPGPVDPGATGLRCAMTAGYSGGPWLLVQRPGTVVAVSSHDFAAGIVYGARLGPGALEAFRRADIRR